MARRHLRSTVPLNQESTTPHSRTRSSRGNTSLSAQSSSRQEEVDTNTGSRSRKRKRKQQPDDQQSPGSSKRATTGSGILTAGISEPASSNLTTDTYPRSQCRNRKRKLPSNGSQSPESSIRATTGGGVLAVSTSEPRSIDLTSSNPGPKCFRISGLPSSWTEDNLFDALHDIDPSLTRQEFGPSLYPACVSWAPLPGGFPTDRPTKQTALLNLNVSNEHLHSRTHLSVSELASRTAAVLKIDSDFYNLTPLNVPKGDIVAELVFACATVKDADIWVAEV